MAAVERSLQLEGPIFNFHDDGRKGSGLVQELLFSQCCTCNKLFSTWCFTSVRDEAYGS